MAINIKFGSVTQNKRVDVHGVSTIHSYDIMVYVALDTAPEKPVGTKTVNVDAIDKTVEEMQTDFKNQLRDWWIACEAEYAKEVQMRGIINTAITDLEEE